MKIFLGEETHSFQRLLVIFRLIIKNFFLSWEISVKNLIGHSWIKLLVAISKPLRLCCFIERHAPLLFFPQRSNCGATAGLSTLVVYLVIWKDHFTSFYGQFVFYQSFMARFHSDKPFQS